MNNPENYVFKENILKDMKIHLKQKILIFAWIRPAYKFKKYCLHAFSKDEIYLIISKYYIKNEYIKGKEINE